MSKGKPCLQLEGSQTPSSNGDTVPSQLAPEQQEQLQEGMGFDSEPLSGFGIWQVFMQPKLVLNLLRGLVFCQLDTISVVPGFLLFL